MIDLYNYLVILSVPLLAGGVLTGVLLATFFWHVIGK